MVMEVKKMKDADYIMKRCYYKSPSVISKTMGDEVVLAIIRGNVGDLENVYTLSGVGARIWKLIDSKRNLEDIKNIIVKEFIAESREVQNDLISLFRQLEKNDCVRIQNKMSK